MTGNTSKLQARRRVREAQARANETRAQRERANIEDAATYMVAVGKVSEVDVWETERLTVTRDKIRTEACRRRADYQAAAGVAVAQMQQRGETLTTIAELTGTSISEVRAMLRHALTSDEPQARSSSKRLIGGRGADGPAAIDGEINDVVTNEAQSSQACLVARAPEVSVV